MGAAAGGGAQGAGRAGATSFAFESMPSSRPRLDRRGSAGDAAPGGAPAAGPSARGADAARRLEESERWDRDVLPAALPPLGLTRQPSLTSEQNDAEVDAERAGPLLGGCGCGCCRERAPASASPLFSMYPKGVKAVFVKAPTVLRSSPGTVLPSARIWPFHAWWTSPSSLWIHAALLVALSIGSNSFPRAMDMAAAGPPSAEGAGEAGGR